jgi:hypothetical protein
MNIIGLCGHVLDSNSVKNKELLFCNTGLDIQMTGLVDLHPNIRE